MTVTIVRGIAAPAVGVVGDLITVPAGLVMGGVLVLIKNWDAVARHYTISVAVGGGATAVTQNVCTNRTIPPGKTIGYAMPLRLKGGDKIRVMSDGVVTFTTQQAAQSQ